MEVGKKVYINSTGNMTKKAAMLIYGKKTFFYRTNDPMIMKLCMEQYIPNFYSMYPISTKFIPAFQHQNAAEAFGAVGIAGLYIGRLRNCLPFLTSFTQRRMANLHIKCFDSNAYQ